jgi:hypothetical protein
MNHIVSSYFTYGFAKRINRYIGYAIEFTEKATMPSQQNEMMIHNTGEVLLFGA